MTIRTDIHFGLGDPAGIDWETPIASGTPGQETIDVAVALEANRRYLFAARNVSDADVKEHGVRAMAVVEVDEAGQLKPAPLPRPLALAIESADAESVRLSFACRAPLGFDAPETFEILSDGGTGTLDEENPVAVLSDLQAQQTDFVVSVPVASRPAKLAIRATRSSRNGPRSRILTIPAETSPSVPVVL